MKKIMIIILAFALIFAGCVDDGRGQNDPNPPGVQPPIDEPSVEDLNESVIGDEMNISGNDTLDLNVSLNQTDEIEVQKTQNMHMLFLNVGYGDATVIKAGKRIILIDTGADGQSVSAKLAELDITDIDLLIISTWDDQKVGGVRTILRDFEVSEVWMSKQTPANYMYELIESSVQKQEVLITHPKNGENYTYGDIFLEVYNPQEEEYLDYANANSIAIRVSFDDFCAFLPSDLEQALEQPAIGTLDSRTCAVYKWRSNGEGRPEPSVLFDRVSPSDVVISVGPNSDGRPSSTTIQRLGIARVGIYRTDIDGNVYVNATRNGRYVIEPMNDLQNLSKIWN